MLVIGLLLASSIVSVNAFDVEEKNNISYSGELLSSDLDGYLVPTYLITWDDNSYYASEGRKSIVHDGYLYHAVSVQSEYLEGQTYTGILKYRTSDGTLCDFKIWTDEMAVPRGGMVILDDYLYLCCVEYPTTEDLKTILLKYSISGNGLNFIESTSIYDLSGHGICADEDDNIYICCESFVGLFLQKYNTDLEPIWNEPKHWDGPYDYDECWGMTFYDGSIFLTGSSTDTTEYPDNKYNSFVLKFDSNGNLLEEIFGLNDDQCGGAIKGHQGKIYVAYIHVETLSESYNVDFKISAYDTNLVNL